LTIEAKAGEVFGELVKDWLPKQGVRSGKPERLSAIQGLLGIADADVSGIRYQLLHRTASALKEAERFRATKAIMLVQSFDRVADEQSWKDFIQFGEILGAKVGEGSLAKVNASTRVPLLIGWVNSRPADLGRLSAAV
jgi:hypothetical protein